MSRRVFSYLIATVVCAAVLVPLIARPSAAADDAVIVADKALMIAFEKNDRATIDKYLDDDFTWVDQDGVMAERKDALALGRKPILGEDGDVKIRENKVGDQVVWLHVDSGNKYVARVWVKRGSAWKLLHTTEIVVRPASEQIFVHSPYPIPCVNPCQTVPFTPLDKMQAGTLADWQVQVGSREAFKTHVDDNQAMVSTYGGQSVAKGIRMAGDKLPPPPPGPPVGSPPVLWMKMYTFAPDTTVVLAIQPIYGQKAYWSSRVFHFQNGYWQMMESYHNTIQAATVLTEVEGK